MWLTPSSRHQPPRHARPEGLSLWLRSFFCSSLDLVRLVVSSAILSPAAEHTTGQQQSNRAAALQAMATVGIKANAPPCRFVNGRSRHHITRNISRCPPTEGWRPSRARCSPACAARPRSCGCCLVPASTSTRTRRAATGPPRHSIPPRSRARPRLSRCCYAAAPIRRSGIGSAMRPCSAGWSTLEHRAAR
jgi:hypothetical protein